MYFAEIDHIYEIYLVNFTRTHHIMKHHKHNSQQCCEIVRTETSRTSSYVICEMINETEMLEVESEMTEESVFSNSPAC